MGKLPVLLLEDDPKVAAQIKDALRDRLEIKAFDKTAGFLSAAKATPDCLAVIDFDLREMDGILAFKKLREINPQARAVMISSANNIPLAVSASKLGMLEFLRKPLIIPDFIRIVEGLAGGEEIRKFSFNGIPDTEWLAGASPKLLEFENNIIKLSARAKDLILVAERGINKKTVVRLIKQNGFHSAKKLIEFDLSSFARESLEGHFWAALNELLSTPGIESVKEESEQTGIIFIEGFENVSDHFRASVFDFIKNRAGKPNFNPEVQVILGVSDVSYLERFGGFELLIVPALRERKEDLPLILAKYLKNKTDNKAVSVDVLEFMGLYDFPGNYEELENMIVGGFSFSREAFISYLKPQTRFATLSALRDRFEKAFIGLLLSKTKRDIHAAARFLSIPKTVLDERVRELNL